MGCTGSVQVSSDALDSNVATLNLGSQVLVRHRSTKATGNVPNILVEEQPVLQDPEYLAAATVFRGPCHHGTLLLLR